MTGLIRQLGTEDIGISKAAAGAGRKGRERVGVLKGRGRGRLRGRWEVVGLMYHILCIPQQRQDMGRDGWVRGRGRDRDRDRDRDRNGDRDRDTDSSGR